MIGFYLAILYFAWEDQSDAAYRILNTVLINCTVQIMQYIYIVNWANHNGTFYGLGMVT